MMSGFNKPNLAAFIIEERKSLVLEQGFDNIKKR